jgi:hypothetical protein
MQRQNIAQLFTSEARAEERMLSGPTSPSPPSSSSSSSSSAALSPSGGLIHTGKGKGLIHTEHGAVERSNIHEIHSGYRQYHLHVLLEAGVPVSVAERRVKSLKGYQNSTFYHK